MNNEKTVRSACYLTNISMAVVGNLPALLFLTFRNLYSVSYALLGSLVLINFCTQLIVDFIFSFFSHKINMQKAVKITPVLTVVGLIIYGVYPLIFQSSGMVGIIIGTVIFSAGSGFAEVLISPVIASLPSENPERDMSKLHSIYAWGVVGVVLFSALFLYLFGSESWYFLPLIFTLIHILATIFFAKSTLPKMQTPEKASGVIELLKTPAVWFFFFAMFFGGASEVTMAQWSSSYIEQALKIPKVIGDIFGVALFSVMLGLGRTLYAKYGKNIEKVLFISAIGASICYLTAVCSNSFVGLIACGLTGICVAMMWPGTLVASSSRIPQGGVFVYAMMAAGGDFGASVGPQLVGLVTDIVKDSSFGEMMVQNGFQIEQLSMRIGLLVGAIFPIIAIIMYSVLIKNKNGKKL